MIQLSNAGKRFGHKLLYENLNWLITPNERSGLVGGNGTGKSTLLKVIGGMDTLDMGDLTQTKGVTTGYLPQDGLSLSGRTVFTEVMSVFDRLRALEVEMEALTHSMPELDPSTPEYAAVADRFHRIESEFTAHDGYALESQAGTVLTGLGFKKEDWTRRTEEFSGGWQMRISLAKLLLEKPNMLLLDEPTNHLDLEARNWLEDYLKNYPYAFVLISHDRYFLDVTVNKIVEIWNKGVHFYSGNYEKFLSEKEMRKTTLEAAYKNQKEKIEQLEAFINRFRAQATKAKQVQSRIKELEKIERIEIPPDEKTIHFTFPQPKPSGKVVAEFKNVGKSYGDKFVFGKASFVIERGERIALVGPNGAGKSTMIKLLAGLEPLTTGDYTLGHNVGVDYFAQDQYKELNGDAKMLDDLRSIAGMKTETELRSLLGCFLFSEDDVFKRISVLSGGERNRYALAKLLLQPSNFILLDEPTNHLDMRAKDVLLEALSSFTGTVVLVSHDRYFIDKLATKVYEIDHGEVVVFPGNYEDFHFRKQGGVAAMEAGIKSSVASSASSSQASAEQQQAAPDSSKKRVNPIKLKQMQQDCTKLENRVSQLETDIATCEQTMSNPSSQDELMAASQRVQKLIEDRDATMQKWEVAAAALEELQ